MIWSGIIICGAITFLIRFIPMSGIISRKLSPSTKNSFKYIPLAVLTPIIVNELSIIENNTPFLIENYKLYAGLISIIVALITNNILATISIGMASYLFMSNFINI
ncbi:AzlD domain-containing protein [Alphaproteobacteria bacterium]|nr:AzlD domain-containing protein [Alphaproteobacteria bacterium]